MVTGNSTCFGSLEISRLWRIEHYLDILKFCNHPHVLLPCFWMANHWRYSCQSLFNSSKFLFAAYSQKIIFVCILRFWFHISNFLFQPKSPQTGTFPPPSQYGLFNNANWPNYLFVLLSNLMSSHMSLKAISICFSQLLKLNLSW